MTIAADNRAQNALGFTEFINLPDLYHSDPGVIVLRAEENESFETIKDALRTQLAPVIVLSETLRPEDVVTLYEEGIADFVYLPTDQEILDAKINAWAGRYRSIVGQCNGDTLSASSAQVWVVDDSVQYCQEMREILSGYNVRTMSSVSEVSEAIERGEFPAIIIQDQKMESDQSGLLLLEKYNEQLPCSLTVVVSAYIDKNRKVLSYEHGAVCYTGKHFRVDVFRKRIAAYIAWSEKVHNAA